MTFCTLVLFLHKFNIVLIITFHILLTYYVLSVKEKLSIIEFVTKHCFDAQKAFKAIIPCILSSVNIRLNIVIKTVDLIIIISMSQLKVKILETTYNSPFNTIWILDPSYILWKSYVIDEQTFKSSGHLCSPSIKVEAILAHIS